MKIEYRNLFVHFVFTTLHRLPLISADHRERIEKYFTGIVNRYGSKLYAIYANPEHVHILLSKAPDISEETLATILADSSERFINKNKLCTGKFEWQQTASSFSVSKSDVDRVCKYIFNQPEHHKKISFQHEYDSFIKFYQQKMKYEK